MNLNNAQIGVGETLSSGEAVQSQYATPTLTPLGPMQDFVLAGTTGPGDAAGNFQLGS